MRTILWRISQFAIFDPDFWWYAVEIFVTFAAFILFVAAVLLAVAWLRYD